MSIINIPPNSAGCRQSLGVGLRVSAATGGKAVQRAAYG